MSSVSIRKLKVSMRKLKKYYKEMLLEVSNSQEDIKPKVILEKLKYINLLIRQLELNIYIMEHKKNET